MPDSRKELFSERALAGSRTYFFDVKQTQDGTRYLVISETRRTDGGHEHHRIMIFEENLAAFSEGLRKALNYLQK